MSLSFNQMKTAVNLIVRSGHVPNIIGLQGIGKSDLVREYARENDFAFEEITCSLIQEGDLAMPFIRKNGQQDQEVDYAINRIITNLAENSKSKEIGILFLDEFNRAPSPQVQSELMNLVLQREVVGYKLPKNVHVVLAMNPSSEMEGYGNTNYSVSFSDMAMLGRVVSLDMKPILSDWLDYGKRVVDGKSFIHKSVMNYLCVNKDEFVTEEEQGSVNNTPRGWSRVSDILYTYESMGVKDVQLLKNILRGTLRRESADAFASFYKNSVKTVNYQELAVSTLNARSFQDWSGSLFNLNDAELNKVYNFMLESVSGGINNTQKENLITFVTSVQNELAFSWVSKMEKNYPSTYEVLLEDEDFSSFVLNMLVNVKSVEVGGFHGK